MLLPCGAWAWLLSVALLVAMLLVLVLLSLVALLLAVRRCWRFGAAATAGGQCGVCACPFYPLRGLVFLGSCVEGGVLA